MHDRQVGTDEIEEQVRHGFTAHIRPPICHPILGPHGPAISTG